MFLPISTFAQSARDIEREDFVYIRFLVVLIWFKESVCPIFIKIDMNGWMYR